jgi:hypothetical protein
MKILNYILLLVAVITCFSCNKTSNIKNQNFIDIENNIDKSRVVNLSEIAESVDYIPLETTSESIVGELSHEKLIYENGLIFYKHRHLMKIFDSKGKFKSTFNKHGNGAKEYISSSQTVVSQNAKVITIGTDRNIQEYDTNGEFLRTIDLPIGDSIKNVIFSRLGIIANIYYVLTTSINNKENNLNYSSIVIDSASNILLTLKYPEKEREFVKKLPLLNRVPNLSPSLYKYKDEIRIINGNDDNIISINNELKIDTVYKLNYGKYNRNNPQNEEYNVLDRYKSFFESSSYLFMQFRTNSLPLKKRKIHNVTGKIVSLSLACSFFNKKTGEFTFIDPSEVDEFGFKDDINNGPAVWPLYISHDDYMVTMIEAYKFIQYAQTHKVSDKFKKIADSLKEDDNPVVVLVKLKK